MTGGTVRLGDLVSFVPGFAFRSPLFGTGPDGLPLVRIRDVARGVSRTYYRGDYDPRFLVHDGDLLIAMDGEFNLGHWRGGEALLNQRVCKVERVSAALDRRYLAHFLSGRLKEIEAATPFVTVKHLSVTTLRNTRLDLPPLGRQRRVADMLDEANALGTKRRESLQLLEELRRAVFSEMFGARQDILTRWPVRPLGDLAEFITSGSRGWAAHYVDGPGSLFLRIQNVRHDRLLLDDVAHVDAPDTTEARRTRVRAGDVLLSITADLGRTAVIPDDLGPAYINQHLSLIRTGSIVPDFLSAYLASPSGQDQIYRRNRHGVKAGLNFDDIRSLRIPTPPERLQESFMERQAALRGLGRRLIAHTDHLDALRDALRHRCLGPTARVS